MTVVTDTELYLRGTETLLASWQEYARGASDSALRRFPGVAAAVFPNEPERTVHNNAVLAASVGIGANTTFVVSVQLLCVLIMVVAAPPLVRIVTRWDTVQSG